MAFINYFSILFTSNAIGDMEACLQNLENRVTDEMNRDLLKPFMVEEIWMALFQIGPLKAQGPDGFPTRFYQSNWCMVGDDICHAILDTLNSGILPSFLNSTNITFIPKIKNPTLLRSFDRLVCVT
jgi:hypothetical protein